MSQAKSSTTVVAKNGGRGSGSAPPAAPPRPAPRPGGGGLLKQYKAEQGKWTRLGTFVGLLALIAWGARFLYLRLNVYEDIGAWWGLLITTGIPIAFLVLLGALAWWISYSSRKSGDFMIATEGEMKKVSWSSKREIIGSTKVVIMFTVLLALALFIVDLVFQTFFSSIGVLRTG
jgi:preprotein translocase subunit SecE